MRIQQGLTRKLVLVLLLAILLPLGLLAAGTFVVSRSVLAQQGEINNRQVIGNLATYQHLYARQIESLVLSVANNETIGAALRAADEQSGKDSYLALNTQTQLGYVNDLPI
jgi:pantothenate kinase-related protein Tda10